MIKTANYNEELDKSVQTALSSARLALWEFDLSSNTLSWIGKVTKHFYDFATTQNGSTYRYLEMVHKDDVDHVREAIIQISNEGGTFINQHRLKWPNGDYHWVESIGNAIESESEVRLISGTIQDITEKKAIERGKNDWKEKRELIAKSAGIVVYDFNLRTGHLDWSESIKKLLGFTAKELEDLDFYVTRMHPDDKEQALSELEKSQERIGRYDEVYRFKHANGSYRYIRDKGLCLGKNQAENMLGMIEDVTQIKQAERALIESELRFKSMIHDMNVGVGLYDGDTNPILCNRTAYNLLGMSEKQFMGLAALDKNWCIINEKGATFHQEDFPIPRAIKTKKPVRQEVMGVYRPLKKDWVWLMVDAVPIYDLSDSLIHVICTFTDITALKNAKEKLSEKNQSLSSLAKDLKAKNERLMEFAQIVSHNLRSPLSSIISLLQIYEGGDDVTKAEIIEHIQKVSEHALLTTDELNHILKIQRADSIQSTLIDLDKLLANTIQNQKGAVLDSNALIIGDFSVKEVEFPLAYMESIFLNFLSNSLKYRSNERECQVQVRSFLNNKNQLILEWEDNGLGLDVERNFNDLFKLGKRFHSNEDSRGVGLFLIKNQVEAMGGTISVESVLGAWTKFSINFGIR